jgi:HKD family nuclease
MPIAVRFLPQPSIGDTVGSILREELRGRRWESFRAAIAWVKRSGVVLIQEDLHSFASRPGTDVRIAVGVDNGGSSLEGVDLLWRLIQPRGQLYVNQDPIGSEAPTFHPKVFAFAGPTEARVVVGSSNLTRGGLFLNHEASIVLDLDLTVRSDEVVYRALVEVLDATSAVGPSCRQVDAALLATLHGSGDLPAESTQRRASRGQRLALGLRRGGTPLFGRGPRGVRPDAQREPTGLAAPTVLVVPSPPMATVNVSPTPPATGAAVAVVPQVHVTEVLPHDNGEVFLSYVAVTQDQPAFFQYPFTGWSTPKRARNPAYPMLQPDPIVDIEVFDRTGRLVASERRHGLNVIEYTRNHEIRITVPNGLQRQIPDMSVLEIERDPAPHLDYLLRFHHPGSAEAAAAHPFLVNTMPSGGRTHARRYGWR